MVTVSNTIPLRYLIAIGQEHLFEELFSKIFIPSAVFDELTHPHSPESVRSFISSKPRWLEIRAVNDPGVHSVPHLLHRGERQAIALAETLPADLLLIDEKYGRRAASGRKFKISGTLGVLETAESLGLIDKFPNVLEELKASGFYIKPPLEGLLLRRHDQRKGGR
jgi:predicted nucleic acid-binding protein